jgi:hypothetical protein
MIKLRYFIAVCIIILSGYGFHQLLYFGLASFHTYDDYSRIKTKAKKVVLYHPDNAEYWDLRAQVNEWGFIFGHEENESALLEAKSQYLRATELRPLWPKFWTSLVKLKWRLQEFDEEMLYFFERATVLGLQKPKVHFVVIELGLALYANNHLMLLNIRL